MLLKKLQKVWSQLVRLKWQHLISPRKWGHVIEAKKLEKLEQEEGLPLHLEELIEYRKTRPGCKACVEKGFCDHCGCSIPAAMYVPDNECSGGHWDSFPDFDKGIWDNYKEQYDITITI